MEFIDRLNNLLFENDLSKMSLSKQANIPYTTICGWFNNRLPDYNAIIKLSKFFNITTDYLLGCEKEEKKEIIEKTNLRTLDEQLLIETYRTLSQGKKQALFNMLDIDTQKIKKQEGKYE